jgi:sphinganine-1-phosphate aldolase
MAVKAYRDRAKALRPNVTRPNMIAPITVHPAFEKAAHYFGVEIIHVAVDSTCRVIVSEVKKAINRNTILLIGSAPQYCHGVVDPIEVCPSLSPTLLLLLNASQALSDLALSKGLPLHVDACFGGFMLPWLEKLGYPIPPFDFRVPGVTSISADIHKYGYTSKGASVILYRNAELRSYQYFAYASWPGGLFGSPSLTGSRPGGAIAAAWAALVSLGQNGYLEIAREVMNTTQEIIAGVEKIPGIAVLTKPDMTCVAIVSKDRRVNIHAVADLMEEKGWKIERQQYPDSIHVRAVPSSLTLSLSLCLSASSASLALSLSRSDLSPSCCQMSVLPQHKRIVQQLVSDLSECSQAVLNNSKLNSQGSTGIYGMVAAIPDHAILDDFIVKFFNQIYSVDPVSLLDERKSDK